jgi:hypothetical protein
LNRLRRPHQSPCACVRCQAISSGRMISAWWSPILSTPVRSPRQARSQIPGSWLSRLPTAANWRPSIDAYPPRLSATGEPRFMSSMVSHAWKSVMLIRSSVTSRSGTCSGRARCWPTRSASATA